MIEQYLGEYEKIRPLGKTTRATLNAIKDTWLAELDDAALNSQKLVESARWRMSVEGGGIQAQTVAPGCCIVRGSTCMQCLMLARFFASSVWSARVKSATAGPRSTS